MDLKFTKNRIREYSIAARQIVVKHFITIIVVILFSTSITRAADGTFVKGINLNGNAITIDGNAWISYSTALSNGFSTTASKTFNNNITWSPAVDANTNTMLNSVIYQSAASFSMSQVIANGSYCVYFWLTENYADNVRSEDIKLEGNTIATGIGRMINNTWAKYGPYNVTVNDGVLNIDFVRITGDPQCAGLAIYSNDTTYIPVKDGWSKIEAESYNSSAPSAILKNSTSLSANAGSKWVQFDKIDLHSGTEYLQMNVANGGNNTGIQVLVDGADAGTLTVGNTGGWNIFQTKTFKLNTPQSGIKNVKFVFGKSNVNLDWFMFSSWASNMDNNRVIITTDLGADPDDLQSLVHFLVCSNAFDTEGLIVSTSCWKKSQTSPSMLDPMLNAYGQVYNNLIKHAKGYPTLQYLQSISRLGQKGYSMADIGTGKDSPGSELIIAAADKNDPRPVWIQLWGGGNTLAQALWKVKNTRSQDDVDKFVSKLRVYDILGQDEAGAWMTKTFPDLLYIRFRSVYNWQPSDSWIDMNIQTHGELGAVYPDRKYATEGDSPAFLYQYSNGLGDPEHVDWGSWGGRCDLAEKAGIRGMSAVTDESAFDTYYMLSDASEGGSSISRWSTAIHNDFAARMDWSITNSFSNANHHPIAVVNNDSTRTILQIPATPDSSVVLSAAGSSDPDGNSLISSWWYYYEPSSYHGTVNIQNSSSSTATVVIPSDAGGKNIHVILELHDNGSPNLYAYRRVIINVQ